MTLASILILSGIVSAFLLFGGVLAWGDFYSRRRPGEQGPAVGKETPPATTVAATRHREAA
jgi:hypothetical protein